MMMKSKRRSLPTNKALCIAAVSIIPSYVNSFTNQLLQCPRTHYYDYHSHSSKTINTSPLQQYNERKDIQGRRGIDALCAKSLKEELLLDADMMEFLGLSGSSRSSASISSVANTKSREKPLSMAEKAKESEEDNGSGELMNQQEYELMLGKAMDTLRSDYPGILEHDPDFSIYAEDIEVVDPSGVTLHNIKDYKASFHFLHAIIKFFYCPSESELTFRLIYDCARKNIRISWNALLIPRNIYGGLMNELHVDGISVYELDRSSGLITQHRVETLLINDQPVQPPQGIFQALAREATVGPEGVPAWNIEHSNTISQFQTNHLSNLLSSFNINNNSDKKKQESTLLFSAGDVDNEANFHPLFNQEAYDKKNNYRKRFGLPPITPEEYVRIETEVQELAMAQRQKADAMSSDSAAEMAKQQSNKGSLGKNMFNKFLGNILEDTCESNYDCERPEVCCDLGFKRMCCRSGLGVYNGVPPNMRLEPVPARQEEIGEGGSDYGRNGGYPDWEMP